MLNLKINIKSKEESFEIGGVIIYRRENDSVSHIIKTMIIKENSLNINKPSEFRLLNLSTGILISYSFDTLYDINEYFNRFSNRKIVKYIPPSKITIMNEE